MSDNYWPGDWALLYELRRLCSEGLGPHPRRPMPGAKAIPFDFEVPCEKWVEYLNQEYLVLKSDHYKSSGKAAAVSGEIDTEDFGLFGKLS